MLSVTEEMKHLKEKADNLCENYENFEINTENFDFPFVYLTDDEIIQYNQEFKRIHSKIQVIVLSDYMNLKLNKEVDHSIESNMNLLTNSYKKSIKDILDEEEEEKNKNENDINIISNISNNNSKEKKQNKYINKKRKRKGNSPLKKENKIKSQNKNKKIDKSNISYNNINDNDDESDFTFKTSYDKKKEKKKEKKKMNNNKINKNNKPKKNNNYLNKRKTSIKLTKDKINIDFNNYFKRIKETRNQQQNEEKRKKELIQEISENSQYLSKEGLNDIAINKHIRLVGDEFKIDDLNHRNVNQLEILLGDIKMDANFNKLEPGRKENIRAIKNKEELERKSLDRAIRKKKNKEEKKKRESLIRNKQGSKPKNDNKDNDDYESELSYDENDSLE